MKQRVNIKLDGGMLNLPCMIECKPLRISGIIMSFVIDTGSRESLLSDGHVKKLQLSLNGRVSDGYVRFAGSTYEKLLLPKVTLRFITENKTFLPLRTSLRALRTHRVSEEKLTVAESLPSVLGMEFLEENGVSLHVIPKERMAYLEYDVSD